MEFNIDRKKIAINTLALYIRMGFTMVVSFFVARITLQQLGVEDYGLNNLLSSIVSMLSFLNGSMGTAVQRYYSYEIGRNNISGLKRIFGVGLSLHSLVAVITLIAAEIFAIYFLNRMNIPADRLFAAQIVFQLSIFTLFLNILNVPYAALLRARECFVQVAKIEIIQAVFRLAILYLLTIIDFDKLILLSILNFVITIYYVFSLTLIARKFKETHSFFIWDKKLVQEMFSFISLLIITVLANLIQIQGVAFLINLFFSLTINAAYGITIQISHIVSNFVSSFKSAVVPQIMSTYGAGDLNGMHSLINMGTKISFILMMLFTLPIIFEIDFLLNLWLETPPPHTSELVKLIIIHLNISSFTYFHYQGVHATGSIKTQQLLMSALYITNIIVVYIVFKIGYSFYWSMYINIVIGIIQCIVNLYCAKKRYKYDINGFIRNILIPCILTYFIAIAIINGILFFINPSVYISITTIFASLLLTMSLNYYILLNKDERNTVRSFINKKFNRL